ncbi:hypothetical protein OH492_14000 [Vibrio chagasii]|nr:hypothetical protein [Vibrio chagasii]
MIRSWGQTRSAVWLTNGLRSALSSGDKTFRLSFGFRCRDNSYSLTASVTAGFSGAKKVVYLPSAFFNHGNARVMRATNVLSTMTMLCKAFDVCQRRRK